MGTMRKGERPSGGGEGDGSPWSVAKVEREWEKGRESGNGSGADCFSATVGGGVSGESGRDGEG